MSRGVGRYAALTIGVFILSTAPAWATPIGLELLLLVDVSGSVNTAEYNLQKGGYISAFNDPGIQTQIANTTGGIAVAYAEWSSASQQQLLVGWSHLTDAASSSAFATAIGGTSRAFGNLTAPGSALRWGMPLFTGNGFEDGRLVIDISGDGVRNCGANTFDAATAAHAAGITVNGLAIGGVANWYLSNITDPGGGTLYTAANFNDFEAAVSEKIGQEITPVPEPASLLLLGSGLFGLGLRRSRKRRG